MDTTTATTIVLPVVVLPTEDELKTWVANQPEGATVGLCRSAGECMLAQHLEAKYPGTGFSVSYYSSKHHSDKAGQVHIITEVQGAYKETRFDAPGLADVLERFDHLMEYGTPITREQALTCFEEVDRGGV